MDSGRVCAYPVNSHARDLIGLIGERGNMPVVSFHVYAFVFTW